jgi:hypothetical protein
MLTGCSRVGSPSLFTLVISVYYAKQKMNTKPIHFGERVEKTTNAYISIEERNDDIFQLA